MKMHMFHIFSLVYKGWKNPLDESDFWTTLPEDRTKLNVDVLEAQWKTELQRRDW